MDKTVVVPTSATPEMIAAAEKVDDLYRMGQPQLWARVYRAMISAAPAAAAQQDELAYIAACNLAKAIHAQHYREDPPNWRVLPDTQGVISQISNMVAGLTKASPASASLCLAQQGKREATPNHIERAAEIVAGWPQWKRDFRLTKHDSPAAQDAQERDIRSAAEAVVREALDSVYVHPCDYNNDSVRAEYLSATMRCLYDAITTAQPADKPDRVTPEMWKALDDAKQQLAHGQQLLDDIKARYGLADKQEGKAEQQAEPDTFEQWFIRHRIPNIHWTWAKQAWQDGAAIQPAQPQLSDEEIYTFALRNGYVDMFSDFQDHALLRKEIIKFARALLSRQSGEDKSADGWRTE